MIAGGLHMAWARLFVRSLASHGIDRAVLSPGSRSTALALAADGEPDLEVSVVIDERSAAFVALGHARITGRPCLLVCTSGSAGAHYHPAIIEADAAGIPLVVVTADRPPEEHDARSSQTIDQRKMFGDHVRRYLDLGLPDAHGLASVPRVAALAALVSRSPRPGPVHVNAPFRKPVEPIALTSSEGWEPLATRLFGRGGPRVTLPIVSAEPGAVEALAASVRSADRVVVLAGPMEGSASGHDASMGARSESLRKAVLRFASAAGATVLAESTSGLWGADRPTAILEGVDLPLRAGVLGDERAPELVIRLGAPPVSPVASTLEARELVLLTEAALLPDPSGIATAALVGDPSDLLLRAADALVGSADTEGGRKRARHASLVADLHAATLEAANVAVRGDALSEPAIARIVVASLPRGAALVVGNSLPVRDLDAFGGRSNGDLTVLHQRGAAGIDGLVAGSVGTRLGHPARAPVAAILGDVSAFHDLASFALLATCEAALVIVVVDNGGGRIFDALPLARSPGLAAARERLFATPPPEFLEGVARTFGVTYTRVETASDLRAAIERGIASGRASVVHAVVPPEDGATRRDVALGAARRAIACVVEARKHGGPHGGA